MICILLWFLSKEISRLPVIPVTITLWTSPPHVKAFIVGLHVPSYCGFTELNFYNYAFYFESTTEHFTDGSTILSVTTLLLLLRYEFLKKTINLCFIILNKWKVTLLISSSIYDMVRDFVLSSILLGRSVELADVPWVPLMIHRNTSISHHITHFKNNLVNGGTTRNLVKYLIRFDSELRRFYLKIISLLCSFWPNLVKYLTMFRVVSLSIGSSSATYAGISQYEPTL